MLAQLAPQREGERESILASGLDLETVLSETDLVKSDDVFFAATGITDGVLMPGVHYNGEGAATVSLVMRGRTGTVRTIHAEHRWDKLMSISQIQY